MLRNKFTSAFGFIRKAILVVAVFYAILAIFGNVINRNRIKVDDKAIIAAQQKEIYKVLSDKKLVSTNTGKIALAIYRFSYCSLIGELCTDQPVANNDYFTSSLVGKLTSVITFPYQNQPASGVYWVANTLQNAGFIPSSYAAEGIGYASIKPLMNLWKIFRDVTYLLIVLILVAIGFMIMFRMKLNPQTVISVENSLPKIVVALLLITFSFAIAGFLIDITYLLILLVVNLLSTGDTYIKVQNEIINSNMGTLWDYILPKNGTLTDPTARILYLGNAIASIIPTEISNMIRIAAGGVVVFFVGNAIFGKASGIGLTKFLNGIQIVGNGVGNALQLVIATILNIVIYASLGAIMLNALGFFIGIIVILTFISILLRIFFMLFRSYLQIIITIVFSPLILLIEAVPGKSTFAYWVKSMIGELITFPLVIAMLLVGKIMMTTLTYPGDYWKAPFLGGVDATGFGVILGAGLIFIIPDIVKFVKDAIGVKPLPFNMGVGTFFGGAGTVAGGGMGILQQFSTLSLGMTGFSNITGIGKTPQKPLAAQPTTEEARQAAGTVAAEQRPAVPLGSGGPKAPGSG